MPMVYGQVCENSVPKKLQSACSTTFHSYVLLSLKSENLLKLNFFMFSWNVTGGGSSSNLILWYSIIPTS